MKVRVCNPRNGKWQAFNTDHITKWFTDKLVNRGGDRVPGFSIHVFTTDGRETVIFHDQGGEELLQALETEFFPLNEPPVEEPEMEKTP